MKNLSPSERTHLKDTCRQLISLLSRHYRRVAMPLVWNNAYELLIGVILSANTTDRQVNQATPRLFKAFPTAADMAKATASEVKPYIKSIGLYHTKAANIVATSGILAARYNGQPPKNFDELIALPGVGRKTAHVVRGAWYGLPAVIVDTHFSRVVTRLGLSSGRPYAIEKEIASLIPPRQQYLFSQRINEHGRVCCYARKPSCTTCPLRHLCNYWHTLS